MNKGSEQECQFSQRNLTGPAQGGMRCSTSSFRRHVTTVGLCRALAICLWVALAGSAKVNYCCVEIPWTPDWCVSSDCLGLGCVPQSNQNGFFQCSDIQSCICAPIVQYSTLSFCTVIESCKLAKIDYEFAKKMVNLYTEVTVPMGCLDSLTRILCSYHFPECEKDNAAYNQICFDACLDMFRQCSNQKSNISLAHFASVGARCNFWGIYNPDPAQKEAPYYNKRAYQDGNKKCTWAKKESSFGCFSRDARVLVRNFVRERNRDRVTSISEVRPGDFVLAPKLEQGKGAVEGRGGLVPLGSLEWAKVLYVHDHIDPRQTLRVSYRISTGLEGAWLRDERRVEGEMEVSLKHQIPLLLLPGGQVQGMWMEQMQVEKKNSRVRTGKDDVGLWSTRRKVAEGHRATEEVQCEQCLNVAGEESGPTHIHIECDRCFYAYGVTSLVPAEFLKVGHRILVQNVFEGGDKLLVASIVDIRTCSAEVTYVLTDKDYIIADGVAMSTYSTAVTTVETAPFRYLEKLSPGILQWTSVAASLSAVLESPLLRVAEQLVDGICLHLLQFESYLWHALLYTSNLPSS